VTFVVSEHNPAPTRGPTTPGPTSTRPHRWLGTWQATCPPMSPRGVEATPPTAGGHSHGLRRVVDDPREKVPVCARPCFGDRCSLDPVSPPRTHYPASDSGGSRSRSAMRRA
jgi:hypothetical protein